MPLSLWERGASLPASHNLLFSDTLDGLEKDGFLVLYRRHGCEYKVNVEVTARTRVSRFYVQLLLLEEV